MARNDERFARLDAQHADVSKQLAEVTAQVREMMLHTEMLKTMLIIKEPETVRAAEAYDGLRRQVIASNTERRTHIAQLAELAIAVHRASSVADIAARTNEWLAQADIATITTVPTDAVMLAELYELTGEGDTITVTEPAFVDNKTRTVLRRGRGTRTTVVTLPPVIVAAATPAAAEPAPAPAEPAAAPAPADPAIAQDEASVQPATAPIETQET